jgi:hypothetical protein
MKHYSSNFQKFWASAPQQCCRDHRHLPAFSIHPVASPILSFGAQNHLQCQLRHHHYNLGHVADASNLLTQLQTAIKPANIIPQYLQAVKYQR